MKEPIPTELIDLTTCVFAAHGFALYLTETIERKYKRVFAYKTKQTGKAFIEQLVKSTNLIWELGDKKDLTLELSNQQANIYELCESFLRIALTADRTLTPEARQIFEAEQVQLLKKYNLVI